MKKAPRPDPKTDSELEPAAAGLPAVPREAEAALVAIERSQLCDRMKRALVLVARGASVREAAIAEDYATHTDIYRRAKRYGLLDVRTKTIITQHRHVAKLAVGELEERLVTDPDKITTHALGVIGGIATDKVLAHEKNQTDDGSSYLSALERMAERFAESGAGLELRVQISPAAPKADAAIDVTPTRTE